MLLRHSLQTLALFCLFWYGPPGFAQDIKFPELTGRVVDKADLIDAATEQEITSFLDAHERATGNQIVVATLENLQGRPIEEFGYQLARAWGIGQKGKDNGALLLVGKDERSVRIEVGYGLEGELTDAISSNIINSVILPEFKQGRFAEGIEQGSAAMVQAVGGQYQARAATPDNPQDSNKGALILFILFGISLAFAGRGSTRGPGRIVLGGIAGSILGGGRGGSGGGGFSGGGGGFGGGGASGGW